VTALAPAPTGGGSALKIILIVVAVIVGIGILGVASVSFFVYRVAKNAHVSQQGDHVKAETPFGTFETSKDPEQVAKDLGVDIYPGAEMQRNASTSVTIGSIHTVTAVLESGDSLDKVCAFYKSRFPNAMSTSSDQNRCTIVSNDQKNMVTINIEAQGDSSKLQITNVSKKSN
jgi:tRNA threonylcarbamoyladenosine modification (KEOPS) complex  Pcc1 subunit